MKLNSFVLKGDTFLFFVCMIRKKRERNQNKIFSFAFAVNMVLNLSYNRSSLASPNKETLRFRFPFCREGNINSFIVLMVGNIGLMYLKLTDDVPLLIQTNIAVT